MTVPGRNDARGIYLRDQQELDGPLSIGVKVVPLFEHPTGAGRSASDLDELLETELDIALSATAEWLATPPSMVLLPAQPNPHPHPHPNRNPNPNPNPDHATITLKPYLNPNPNPMPSPNPSPSLSPSPNPNASSAP